MNGKSHLGLGGKHVCSIDPSDENLCLYGASLFCVWQPLRLTAQDGEDQSIIDHEWLSVCQMGMSFRLRKQLGRHKQWRTEHYKILQIQQMWEGLSKCLQMRNCSGVTHATKLGIRRPTGECRVLCYQTEL